MGVFDRFNRVLKSNLNSLVDRAEDPAKLLDQTVIDMDTEIRRAKQDLITQLGTAKRLEKKVEEARAEVQSWEDKAVLALRAADEGLARDALRMKHKAKQALDATERRASAAASAAEKLQQTLETIEAKLEDLKARKTTLAAQVRSARAADAQRSDSPALDDLHRLTGRIDQLEAEVEAASVLDDPERALVDAKFRALEKQSGGSAVDDELQALKRKLDGT